VANVACCSCDTTSATLLAPMLEWRPSGQELTAVPAAVPAASESRADYPQAALDIAVADFESNSNPMDIAPVVLLWENSAP